MTNKGNGDQMIDELLGIEDAPEEPKRKRKNDELPPFHIQMWRGFKAAWESNKHGTLQHRGGKHWIIRITTVWVSILILIGILWFIVALFGLGGFGVISGVIFITLLIASVAGPPD